MTAKRTGTKAAKKPAERAAKKATTKPAKRAARKAAKKAAGRTRAEQRLDRVRRIVHAWPEVDERLSHGMPTFWGGRKTFANFALDHHGDGRTALWIKSDPETMADLIEARPETFFSPPYVGSSGWIGVEIGGRVDWALVAGLLETGYRAVAPKRALLQLDASR